MRFGRTVNLFCDEAIRGRTFRFGTIVGALLTAVLMSLAPADEPAAKADAKKKVDELPLSPRADDIEAPAKPAKESPVSKGRNESKLALPIKAQSQKPAGKKAVSDRKGSSNHKSMSGKPGSVDSSSSVFELVSPKREAAAVFFAKQHHAELAELLDRLKASHPEQYTKAICELDRTRDKLEKQRERDADRYEFLLREWQLASRVRLLAARISMGGTPELEAELRQVLLERHDVRLQLLTYDRERSKARMQKFDEQIAEHVQNRAATIDRELDKIKKNADARKRSLPNKSAIKRSAETDTKK